MVQVCVYMVVLKLDLLDYNQSLRSGITEQKNARESAKIACYLNMRSECLLTTDDKTDEHVFPEMSVLTTDLEAGYGHPTPQNH